MRDDLFDLTGQVALVTGASSGIGRRMAAALASAGAAVVLLARRAETLRAVSDEIADAGGRAAPLPGDIGDLDAVEPLAAAAALPFGAPRILVNAAGINPRLSAGEVSSWFSRQALSAIVDDPVTFGRRLAARGQALLANSLATQRSAAEGAISRARAAV